MAKVRVTRFPTSTSKREIRALRETVRRDRLVISGTRSRLKRLIPAKRRLRR